LSSDCKLSSDGKKDNKGGNPQSNTNTSKDLVKKALSSKDGKDWSPDKQEKVHINQEKAFESILELVRIDRYKVRACQQCGK
jgi:hypothetical protein